MGGGSILSAQSVTAMTTPKSRTGYPASDYGYGLFVDHAGNQTIRYHDGAVAGYGSLVQIHPEENFGVFILLNADWAWPSETLDTAIDLFTEYEITDFEPNHRNLLAPNRNRRSRDVPSHARRNRSPSRPVISAMIR